MGTGSINFCPTGLPAGTAVFTYTAEGVSGTKQITRLAYGNDTPKWTTGTDYTDLWWSGNTENGWGVNITQHGNNVFVAFYIYDVDGRPMFVIMPGVTFTGSNSITSKLYSTTGPWFGNTVFDPSLVKVTEVGNATITFSNTNNAVITYTLNGVSVTKYITRQLFGNSPPKVFAPQPVPSLFS